MERVYYVDICQVKLYYSCSHLPVPVSAFTFYGRVYYVDISQVKLYYPCGRVPVSVSAFTWLTVVCTLPAATPVRYCTSRLPSKQLLPPLLLVYIV